MPQRVLVLDDDEDTLYGLKEVLESPSVQISTAECIKDAEALLEDSKYDVVIADLMLGSSNPEGGLGFVQQVKTHHAGTEIIAVTGCGESDIADRAFGAGADLFFAKPVPSRWLQGALETLRAGRPLF